MKEKLKKVITEALKELSIDAKEVVLEHPADLSHGDYSTSVALVYSKQLKIKPAELASQIAAFIEKNKPEEIEKIDIAGPGFINFHLSKKFFIESVGEILKQGERWGKNSSLAGQKTIIEYTDPNPFKELHIGHLMSNTIGEALSRILEANGAEIKRACYQGDVGLHVAKAVWGMMNLQKTAATLSEQAAYLGKAYAHGATVYEENPAIKEEINSINKKVYERTDASINELYDWGRKVSLEYFETIYKKLGTKFDFYFFESETGKIGKEIVENNIGKVFEKSEGAVIFKGEDHGLHTRVFLNKEGLPTYEAKELGLAGEKYKKYPYEKSIVITGNEVSEYFKVLLKVMSLIYPELAAKTVHLSHGMLRLPTGKMSSRKGDVITAESLIKQVEALVSKKMEESEKLDDKSIISEIAEKVSIAALKYSILKQSPGKDIVFDFDKSLSFEGDSGPYLQYTAVRAKSVLDKAAKQGIEISITEGENPGLVEKILYRFPEINESALKELGPQYVVTYLTELAGAFNAYYANNKIVDNPAAPYRLALTSAVHLTLKNGLNLLGIETPLRM